MFSQWKSLKNYIHVFKNVVPRVLCDEIVNYYRHSNEWENAKVQGSFADKNSYVKETTRNCSELLLTNSMFQKPLYNIIGNKINLIGYRGGKAINNPYVKKLLKK